MTCRQYDDTPFDEHSTYRHSRISVSSSLGGRRADRIADMPAGQPTVCHQLDRASCECLRAFSAYGQLTSVRNVPLPSR